MNSFIGVPRVRSSLARLAAIMLCSMIGLISAQANATNVLLLTTQEVPSDGRGIITNCEREFLTWKNAANPLDPTDVRDLTTVHGKLNDPASPLVIGDLFPAAGGRYDVIAACTVYANSLPQSSAIINQAIKTRVARAFILFDENAAFKDGWINAKTDWNIALSAGRGGSLESQVVNSVGRYSNTTNVVPAWLNPMRGHSYGAYKNVPVDNVLYTPAHMKVAAGTKMVDGASTLVVPLFESYKDASGVAQGACVMVSTDSSMFDTNNYGAQAARVLPSFMDAATIPGGPCTPLPTITKSFTPAVLSPGGTSELKIEVQNNGGYTDSAGLWHPAPVISGLNVTDNLPAPLVVDPASITTTCTGATAAAQGSNVIHLANASLPANGCSISAQVTWPTSATAQCLGTAKPLTNTILSGTDFTASPSQAPLDASAQLACVPVPVPVLNIGKTASVANAVAGDPVQFTVTVTNSSTVPATGVSLADPKNSNWSSFDSWSCTSTDAANPSCGSGTGDVGLSALTVPAQGSLTVVINAKASGNSANSINQATLNPGSGVCSNGSSSCFATVMVNIVGSMQITKTLTSPLPPASAVPGGVLNYQITLTNASSTVPVANPIRLQDALPNGVSSGTWTCVSGAACGGLTNGAFDPGTRMMDVSVPQLLTTTTSQNTVTFNVVLTVDPANTLYASIVNTANATTSGGDICRDTKTSSCSASAAAVPVVLPGSVLISKRLISSASVAPGGVATYEIKVSNPSTTNNVNQAVNVSDALPANASGGSWTCAGSVCPAASGSSLPLNQTLASLPAGAMVTYVVTVNVAANAAHGSTVNNTAIVTPTAPDLCTGNTCSSSALPVSVIVPGAVTVAKTLTSSAQATRGAAVTYQIVVGNSAKGPIEHAVAVVDNLPSGLENGVLTCTVNCTNATITSATGAALAAQIAGLPAGTSVTFQVTANIKADAAANSSITNVATATPGSTRDSQEFCEGNMNSCSASAPPVKITVPDVPEPPVVQPVPATDHWALMLMSALLALAFVVHRRRSR